MARKHSDETVIWKAWRLRSVPIDGVLKVYDHTHWKDRDPVRCTVDVAGARTTCWSLCHRLVNCKISRCFSLEAMVLRVLVADFVQFLAKQRNTPVLGFAGKARPSLGSGIRPGLWDDHSINQANEAGIGRIWDRSIEGSISGPKASHWFVWSGTISRGSFVTKAEDLIEADLCSFVCARLSQGRTHTHKKRETNLGVQNLLSKGGWREAQRRFSCELEQTGQQTLRSQHLPSCHHKNSTSTISMIVIGKKT